MRGAQRAGPWGVRFLSHCAQSSVPLFPRFAYARVACLTSMLSHASLDMRRMGRGLRQPDRRGRH